MENDPRYSTRTETERQNDVKRAVLADRARTSGQGSQHGQDEPPSGSRRTAGFRGMARRAILALVLVAALGVGFFAFHGGASKDDVTDQTKKEWAASFLAAQPLRVDLVEPSQVPAVVSQMQLPATDKQRLQSDIDGGRTRLVWVTLRDIVAEDGDIVRIDSGAYSQTVLLKHDVQRIAVPEPPSGTINIVGIHDGGGGITVGMMSVNSPVNLPVMAVGQVLGVPVVLPR